MTKTDVINLFSVTVGGYTVALLQIADIKARAQWPSYTNGNAVFNLVIDDDNALRAKYDAYNSPERIAVSIFSDSVLVGIIAFNQIEWKTSIVNNMTVRIHPDYINKGIGTTILKHLTDLLLRNGCRLIKLDVNENNNGAIKCYTKAGFLKTGEIQQGSEMHFIFEKRVNA